MKGQSRRLSQGGRIDRSQPLSFRFDGLSYTGFAGDTLASALLANGVRLVGRSFKYHRPRGIFSAGSEEPNALVTLRSGARHEPNLPATGIELYQGLEASSQNRWPSLNHDMMSFIDWFSKPFAAGFYYKTFMGPTRRSWMLYEKIIRKAAGLGEPTTQADPDTYEKSYAFCDLLVVGGGPAGVAAALSAGRSGMQVILVDDDMTLGGSLLGSKGHSEWLQAALDQLNALANVRIMTRTTVFGAYDSMTFGLLERVSDHLKTPAPFQPRQRYWQLRAKRVVLASGMIERPIVFGNNDRPGIMLASATRTYINRFAVAPGRSAVVFTNNDTAYGAALDLKAAGTDTAIVDVRARISGQLAAQVTAAGIALHLGCAIGRANGVKCIKSVDVVAFDPEAPKPSPVKMRLACDLLAISGGWTPTLHLIGQRGAKPVYDETKAMLVAAGIPDGFAVIGGAAGEFDLRTSVVSGLAAGNDAAGALGFTPASPDTAFLTGMAAVPAMTDITPVWLVPHPLNKRPKKSFVDFQHDVGVDDISLAHREGYVSVEHLKRYTTLGMAPDQGKTANVNALGILAGIVDRQIGDVGTTTFRPPYTPVAIGALAGPEVGQHFKPTRRTPMHNWHVSYGAKLTTTGLWLRPWYFPTEGESKAEAYVREARQVRQSVGLCDVSSLGKIDIQGLDSAELLNRIYVNGFKALAVGKARYGVMLRPDGIVLDDGTTSRISEDHYFMTTTTGGAGKVMANLEFLLQTAWPDLRVHVTSVTGQWAGMALAGPRSRALLETVVSNVDLSDDAFPFMGVRHGRIGDIPVRLLRISFSGERAYEVYTPAGYGEAIWQTIHDQGKGFDLVVYGTEALGALRIEKGHVAGPELDGRTTLADLGLGRMASSKKPFLGSALMQREGLVDGSRPQLVGLELAMGQGSLRAGAILCDPEPRSGDQEANAHKMVVVPDFGAVFFDSDISDKNRRTHEEHGIGFISSVSYSPELKKSIAIGFLTGGMSREGDEIDAIFPLEGETARVRITSAHFVDPQGERLHG